MTESLNVDPDTHLSLTDVKILKPHIDTVKKNGTSGYQSPNPNIYRSFLDGDHSVKIGRNDTMLKSFHDVHSNTQGRASPGLQVNHSTIVSNAKTAADSHSKKNMTSIEKIYKQVKDVTDYK